MHVAVLGDPASYSCALKALFDWADSVDLACAWATADQGRAPHWRAITPDKIRRAVIGVQFSQTEPWVLQALRANDRLRIGRGGGTFHPKVFLGTKGTRMRAIVGSANFTGAAFSTNVELGLQLEGTSSDAALRDLASFLQAQWKGGRTIDDAWMLEYQLAYEESRRRRPPETPMLPGDTVQITSVDSLRMSWDSYYRMLLNQEGRLDGVVRVFKTAPSYTVELDNAQDIFRRFPRFADTPSTERKMLMGITPASSGLIGSMSAAGYAKQLVNQEPEKIGLYLDRIPLKGEVSLKLVSEVVTGLSQLRGVKLGVITRLLAVKRPDVFVSINKGSNPKLATLLQRKEVTKPEHYLSLLEAVWQLDWHRATAPADPQQRVAWERRAALLDSVLYETV